MEAYLETGELEKDMIRRAVRGGRYFLLFSALPCGLPEWKSF